MKITWISPGGCPRAMASKSEVKPPESGWIHSGWPPYRFLAPTALGGIFQARAAQYLALWPSSIWYPEEDLPRLPEVNPVASIGLFEPQKKSVGSAPGSGWTEGLAGIMK